jgi:hypothetical protein
MRKAFVRDGSSTATCAVRTKTATPQVLTAMPARGSEVVSVEAVRSSNSRLFDHRTRGCSIIELEAVRSSNSKLFGHRTRSCSVVPSVTVELYCPKLWVTSLAEPALETLTLCERCLQADFTLAAGFAGFGTLGKMSLVSSHSFSF